jgi:hypothetical protein
LGREHGDEDVVEVADVSWLPDWEFEEMLSELRSGTKPEHVAKRYGMCVSGIYHVMKRYGIQRRSWRKWTEEEDELIRLYYPEHGPSWSGWAKLMPERDASKDSIAHRANHLGIKRKRV